ncbi:MAG: class I SAM-dependent DNA methyltransferase [Campylobacteraceae bacterium]|jgi:methylase of polypeptide subunit release factors|nr:class I SAM-dependent DNA methyltransferase [bacterium]MBT5324124.1 class I SAM-dependent DNA methyltransferase [Campylobacteraceae bacterium]MBT7273666.1 class I SAM-dependent DNA methyltransferase [Campylobacteraceae bacterium]
MALSWNEIKNRAINFSKEWETEEREHAESQSFWNDFFNIFGISRKRVASFEEPVNKLGDKRGRIDLFWKGTLLVEHKSKGKDLDKAYTQALDYFPGLKENELPQYILVSDFNIFRLYDLEENTTHEFNINELYKNISLFGFIAGYTKHKVIEEDPVNIKAAELMGKLHDELKSIGYDGHALELFLVRLLFLQFAEDSNIFEKGIFTQYIEERTHEDGSDLGAKLTELYQVLNTDEDKRLKTRDESLANFPYTNGKLFEEFLPIPAFDTKMRDILLECCYLDWSKISPAIFGSLFQSIMDKTLRRNLGAHYTSEANILKLIKPLFLDDLYLKFDKVKKNKNKLQEFHKELSTLNFFDPACGSGNFLIIAYRELRILELEILKILHTESVLDIESIVWCDVDQFHGIEVEEFPAQIAQVAMWLIDHQMNMMISEYFGQYFVRLPLKKSANIVYGNSLQLNWEEVVNKDKLSFILGNPPFIGKQLQTKEQKEDMKLIFGKVKGAGVLDYVTAWYLKSANLIQGTSIKVAFVSTNSIAQGEQVGILWKELFNNYGIKIHFAHQTFNWSNEAKSNAAVHVVIVGFANFNIEKKKVFEYEDIKAEAHEKIVKNINPYLVEGKDLIVEKRRKPICNVPNISFGSMPNDGGNFLLTDEEKTELIQNEPLSDKYIKPLLSAREFLNAKNRWCLWLEDLNPNDLKSMPLVKQRIENVRNLRESSTREATKKLAEYPMLFGEVRQPKNDFILIPRHFSENRQYLILGYFDNNNIASDSCLSIDNITLSDFGILTSTMHMTWVKYICGRIKSDYRYSNELVYNNYPFLKDISDKNRLSVEQKAQAILDIRTEFKDSSLANLYDPLAMPPKLKKAHQELDKAVDKCYTNKTFKNDKDRIEFLFELYEEYISEL